MSEHDNKSEIIEKNTFVQAWPIDTYKSSSRNWCLNLRYFWQYNFEIEDDFTKYLKDSYWICSDKHFFIKNNNNNDFTPFFPLLNLNWSAILIRELWT